MGHRPRSLLTLAALAGAALAVTSCSGTPTSNAEFDPEAEVTIDFAYWGNDVRAELYNEAIEAFNEEYPNITVRSSFLAWTEYWEKRRTEASGGNLPDVLQMDMGYLRQYSDGGLLLDLTPFYGDLIDTSVIDESVLANGIVDDQALGLPISTNAIGMFFNPTLAEELGVEAFPGGSWEEYDAWLAEAREAAEEAGREVWGGSGYTSMQAFEIMQRAKGENLFTADGEPTFTKDDLREYWLMSEALRDENLVTPQPRQEELSPLTAFDAAEQLTEITWDTMGVGYLANLGDAYPVLEIQAPPVTVPGAKDLYKKAGMLLSAAETTDHPEAAAVFIDFMTNHPDVGAIFGTNRGIPASSTALEGADISGINAQVLEYEESIADRIGEAPPVPMAAYGPISDLFASIGKEMSFGTLTVDEAVDRLFSEMDVLIEQ